MTGETACFLHPCLNTQALSTSTLLTIQTGSLPEPEAHALACIQRAPRIHMFLPPSTGLRAMYHSSRLFFYIVAGNSGLQAQVASSLALSSTPQCPSIAANPTLLYPLERKRAGLPHVRENCTSEPLRVECQPLKDPWVGTLLRGLTTPPSPSWAR